MAGLISGKIEISIQRQFSDSRSRFEIQRVEFDPHRAGAGGVFEIINPVLLIGSGSP